MTEQNQTLNTALLRAAGVLFAETGYGQTDVETIAREADIDPSFIYSEYSDKAGLCHAWLVSLHQHSESRHAEILQSEADPVDKVRDYFDHLAAWMAESGYAGCPFTRTINSLGTGESPEIRREVKQHKEFVADFFVTLARDIARNQGEAGRLGHQLFLLYSAATTEAKNLEAVWPIERAREIALELSEAAREGKRLSVTQAAG
ncbi:MAG: TetR/AcrR family transcriptional regulator [Opitutales bacterium]